MSKNVYQICAGELTFEIIERIINENLKLELAPEAKLRIQKCLSLIHICILKLLLPEGRGIGDTTDFLVNPDDSGINA